MMIFEEFGRLTALKPSDEKVQTLVRDYISEHYYTCDKKILSSLGKMYSAGGEFAENIDSAGGKGTAVFAADAIEIYCNN